MVAQAPPFSFIIFDLTENILHSFPQVFDLVGLNSQKNITEKLSNNSQKNFMITRILIKLNVIPPQFTER